MYIITVEGMEDEGAYAVENNKGEKVVFFFEEIDDAQRYAILLEGDGHPEMHVLEVNPKHAIDVCEQTGIKYTVITSNDIVIPPTDDDFI
jgi:hypothetical protein